ncbi:unnamed protein product [Heligmosomoides polygyrus]|uniref:SSD domain-containing protein n=1 Tax=Heligmosomoides polygyrus TaxID=6339 RepID=A0A183FAI0_HELPZ|nr:unnamed protein product [Heligmosomoides polygyrus]
MMSHRIRKVDKSSEQSYHIGDPYVPLYKERDRIARAIRRSLRHSLASMFVTSATTAVAFISNLTSEIIVIRCFGVFACLTMLANYTLVVLLLPSTMVLTCSESRRRLLPYFEASAKISSLLHKCRYFIAFAGIAMTIAASVVVFVSPGFPMPRYNPTKVLDHVFI